MDRAETCFLKAKLLRREGHLELVSSKLSLAQELGWNVDLLEREQAFALAQDGQFQLLGQRWGRLFLESGADAPELAESYVTYCLARFRLADAARVLDLWQGDFLEDHRPHLYRGRISFVLQDWAAALKALERAAQLAPHDGSTLLLKAQTHLKLLQFSEAESDLLLVVRREPHNVLAQVALANCQSYRNAPDEARKTLQRVLANQPDCFEALRELGLLEQKLGRHAEAVDVLSRAVRSHMEDADLRHALAKALAAMGKRDDAESHFAFVEEASPSLLRLPQQTTRLSTHPSDVELRHEVATIVWKYRSRADGVLWLKSTLEFDPHHAATHALLAEHYRLAGDERRAAQHQGDATSRREP